MDERWLTCVQPWFLVDVGRTESRFSDVTYSLSVASQTATIGAGLIMIWDTHAALEPHSVNVVGGQVTGVGLAGFILGGGKRDQSLDSTRTATQDI